MDNSYIGFKMVREGVETFIPSVGKYPEERIGGQRDPNPKKMSWSVEIDEHADKEKGSNVTNSSGRRTDGGIFLSGIWQRHP